VCVLQAAVGDSYRGSWPVTNFRIFGIAQDVVPIAAADDAADADVLVSPRHRRQEIESGEWTSRMVSVILETTSRS